MNNVNLQTLSKEELLNLLEWIHTESRDFYAKYQEYWQFEPLMDKKSWPVKYKDEALDNAWGKFHTFMQWTDGIDLPNLGPKLEVEDNF